MDLEMPIMDGLACTRRIRDLEREGKIAGAVPIIAVTANTRLEQMKFALEAGTVIKTIQNLTLVASLTEPRMLLLRSLSIFQNSCRKRISCCPKKGHDMMV